MIKIFNCQREDPHAKFSSEEVNAWLKGHPTARLVGTDVCAWHTLVLVFQEAEEKL